MAVLFKTWLERELGRFLLGWIIVELSRGLTGLIRLDEAKSGRFARRGYRFAAGVSR